VHGIAVEVLGRIGDRRAVAPLVALLKDKGPYENKKAAWTAGEVRLQVAKALGEIGDRRAVVPLIDMLLDATRPHLVEAAATALGKLGDTRAVAPLLTALASAAPHAWGSSSANLAACAAATTLGTLGDRRAIGPLEGVLSNRSADLRMAALIALPKLNPSLALDTQTVKSLITILERGTTSKASKTADEASAAAEILAGHASPEIRRVLTAYHNQQTSYRSQLAQQPRDKLIAELSSIEGDRISWDHPHPEREARARDIRAELDRRRVNDSQK
jgi:HEAT repeat protein